MSKQNEILMKTTNYAQKYKRKDLHIQILYGTIVSDVKKCKNDTEIKK